MTCNFALGASVVYTVDSGTRYRAPLESLIAVLACAGMFGSREPAADGSLQTAGDSSRLAGVAGPPARA